MTRQARKPWMDCVRGIAIVLVVLGHMNQAQSALNTWIYSFHMPVFFVLSGMLIAMRDPDAEKPLGRVLLARARQLLYPYLTFSALVVIYYLLRSKPDYALKVLGYTVVLEGYNALWFLPALLMAECMLRVLLRSRVPNLLGTTVIAAGTSVYAALQDYVIGGAIPAQEGLHYLVLNGLCRAGIGFVFMMAGYQGYLRRHALAHWTAGRLRALCCLALALGAALGMLNGKTDLHYCVQMNPILYYLSALLQCGALIVLFAYAARTHRALEFFGKNSLIVMATHYPLPLVDLMQWLIRRLGAGSGSVDALIGCAAVMAIEAGIILLVNRRLPFLLRLPAGKGRAR
ncbi:MAG: acyltransferase family protein [Clostridia bacterium]|nr:acyltransferase family protein [Clostridia bacterium]